jgi:hypothetical protein
MLLLFLLEAFWVTFSYFLPWLWKFEPRIFCPKYIDYYNAMYIFATNSLSIFFLEGCPGLGSKPRIFWFSFNFSSLYRWAAATAPINTISLEIKSRTMHENNFLAWKYF